MSEYDVVYDEDKHVFLLPKTAIPHDALPNGVYSVSVSKSMMGMKVSLEQQDPEEITLPPYMLSSAKDYCEDVYKTWKARGKNTGALFYGPPGTGKTVNTRYITRQACLEVPVIIIGIDCPVNVGLQTVKKYAPRAVIIIDELEKRFENGLDNQESLVLLDFLDGMFQYDYLTLMTSNSEKLPKTITKRPGRVRFVKYCGPLNMDGVTELLDHYGVNDKHRVNLKAISGSFCRNGIDMITTALSELAKQPDAETINVIASLGCKLPWYIDADDPTADSSEKFKLAYGMEVTWRGLNIASMFPPIMGDNIDKILYDPGIRGEVRIRGDMSQMEKLEDKLPESEDYDGDKAMMYPDDLYIWPDKEHLLEYNSKENYLLTEGMIDFTSGHPREKVTVKISLTPTEVPMEHFRDSSDAGIRLSEILPPPPGLRG